MSNLDKRRFDRSLEMSSQESATWFPRKPKNTSPVSSEEAKSINRVSVIGAGTMGTQIALQCANHGRSVLLYDNRSAAVEQAPARLERLARDLAAEGLLGSDSPARRCGGSSQAPTWPPPRRLLLSSNVCRRTWNLSETCLSNWGGTARRRPSM